jgi:hypothetical protein
MTCSAARVGVLVLGVAVWVAAGCGGGASPPVYPDQPASNAGAKAIELYDLDKDGFLEGGELDHAPGLKAAIKQVDAGGSGKVSAAMIDARIKAWAGSEFGRLPMSCLVRRNGKPLAGATVRFVPEKFLGDAMKIGQGTTDRQGTARITEPGDAEGMSPGFYRVEITKPGETIPAKYNTETTLGQEVANDAAGIKGPTFDLQY